MNCPKCRIKLDHKRYEGYDHYGCRSCHGLFMDFTVLNIKKEVLSKVFRARKESVRLSPKDNKPMNQVHLKGFEIELCRASSHIWLDHGELNKILKTNATTKNNQVIGGEWEWKDLFGSTDAFQFLLEAVVGIFLDLDT
ncbi:MAG: zf-TFIIB domain-containing protein [Lentisphaeria bacterium]|nr:zf-TFIIB domain-containing protein [Lentisphaeria bacterium]